MKKYAKSSQQSMSMHYNKGVPTEINNKFISRRVDAAFISSVNAQKYKNIGLGIIANKEVYSVIVIPNVKDESDYESATSNVLASLLNINGRVLIGDKALKYSLESNDYIDLVKVWEERYHLPFVFALLCYHKDQILYEKIQKSFLKQKVKIPQYILHKATENTGIAGKDILSYLKCISYELNYKSYKGLKKFYRLHNTSTLSSI